MYLEARDFDAALELLERTEVRMPYTFSGYGKSKNADVLSRVLVLLGRRKKMSLNELQRATYLDADKSTLDKIVETMILMEYAKPVQQGGVAYLVYNEEYERK